MIKLGNDFYMKATDLTYFWPANGYHYIVFYEIQFQKKNDLFEQVHFSTVRYVEKVDSTSSIDGAMINCLAV